MANPKNKKPPLYDYARYSAFGIQMAVLVILGVIGGIQLDKAISTTIPIFTIILSFLGLFMAMYFLFRMLKHKK